MTRRSPTPRSQAQTRPMLLLNHGIYKGSARSSRSAKPRHFYLLLLSLQRQKMHAEGLRTWWRSQLARRPGVCSAGSMCPCATCFNGLSSNNSSSSSSSSSSSNNNNNNNNNNNTNARRIVRSSSSRSRRKNVDSESVPLCSALSVEEFPRYSSESILL
ncbi:hypothetical protein F4780DRAFT_758554 [Xylariomycetidae sp. FL0641]|nr:hypothetical protein F4780DRAFT_758554 [Xylariomycetidae sp. FL0641]